MIATEDDTFEPGEGSPHARSAFVTWAHDDLSWEKTVATLVFVLRQLGIVADVDLFHVNDVDVNWATYGVRAIDENEFVLIAVSPAFKERWEGLNNPRLGSGAAREANALKGIFDDDQQAFFEKVKILVLPGSSVADIPLELKAAGQRFEVPSFDLPGLEDLLRTLTSQGTYVPPPVGSVPILPPKFMPDADLNEASLTQLQTSLVRLDDRLSEQARAEEVSDQNLDTERVTVEAALETVQKRISDSAEKRSHGSQRWSRGLGRRPLVGSILALVAVGISLWLSLTAVGGAPSTRTAHAGPMMLAFSRGWRAAGRGTLETPGLGIETPIEMTMNAVSLEAGPLRKSGSVPGNLPPGLTSQIGKPSEGRRVSLGSVPAARYAWNGSATMPARVLFVIATDSGDLAIACQSPIEIRLSRCAAVAATVGLSGLRVLAPGRQASLDKGIRTALAPAVAARRKRSGLSSSRPATRAATARRLAASDRDASTSLARLAGAERIQPAIDALSRAFRNEADSLTRFSGPAGRYEPASYGVARTSVEGAGRGLSAGLAGVRADGYDANLPTLHPPGLPAAAPRRAALGSENGAIPRTPVSPTVVPVITTPRTSVSPARKSSKRSGYERVIVTEPSG